MLQTNLLPSMIDKRELVGMKRELSGLAETKIEQNTVSREVVRKSKELIYSIHRGDMKAAAKRASEMKADRRRLERVSGTEKLRAQYSYSIAVQEYVEALAYYELLTRRRLPTRKQLKADTECYLMGLSDLTGELVRKAVDDMIKERYGHAVWLKDVVAEIYGAMLNLDFEGGEARKKSDQVKWNLSKLEDLVYEATVRGKI